MLPYLLLCREDSGHREHDLRTERCGSRTGARHPARGGQIPHGQTRLRAPAQTLGRRTQLHPGRPLPPPCTRLRTARHQPQKLPLHRLRHPHVRQTHPQSCCNFITASKPSRNLATSTRNSFDLFPSCSIVSATVCALNVPTSQSSDELHIVIAGDAERLPRLNYGGDEAKNLHDSRTAIHKVAHQDQLAVVQRRNRTYPFVLHGVAELRHSSTSSSKQP